MMPFCLTLRAGHNLAVSLRKLAFLVITDQYLTNSNTMSWPMLNCSLDSILNLKLFYSCECFWLILFRLESLSRLSSEGIEGRRFSQGSLMRTKILRAEDKR